MKHCLSFNNNYGLTGIYRNRYGSQQVIGVYKKNNKGFLMAQHLTRNGFTWSKFKRVKNFIQIDPTIMNDLLNDDFKFDYKEGVLIG